MQHFAPALLTLTDGTESIVIRPVPVDASSPIRLTSWAAGAPDFRESTTPLIGLDGLSDGTAFTGGRQVSMDLSVVGDSGTSAYEYAESLLAMTHPSRRPYLYVSRTGVTTDGDWRILLRGASSPVTYSRTSAAKLDFTLNFTAPYGYFESPQREASGSAAVAPINPWVFPVTAPFTFGSGGTTPSVNLTVAGKVPVAPVIYIYGPVVYPPQISLDTGETIKFRSLTLDAGQYVRLDMAERSFTLNGDPANSIYYLIDWSVSRPFRLLPGARVVSTTGSTGDVIVRWRDRRFSI